MCDRCDHEQGRQRAIDALATEILAVEMRAAGVPVETIPTYTGDDPEVIAQLGMTAVVCIGCGKTGNMPIDVVQRMGRTALCPECARKTLGG